MSLSAPANLSPGNSTTLIAVFTPATGSNPSPELSWSLSGSACVGRAGGILHVSTTQETGGTPLGNTAIYSA